MFNCTEYKAKRSLSRLKSLQSSSRCEIKSKHGQGITRLDIDSSSYRFLLSGGLDGSISLFDLEERKRSIIKNIAYRGKRSDSNNNHSKYISSIEWFPWDTGAFITSSMDHSVRIWDTNEFKSVISFNLGSEVYDAKCRCSNSLNVIAAATSKSGLRLCDMNSGLCTHSLSGHLDIITTVAWSPSDEYILASGGRDGSVKLWDVRRGGSSSALISLDWLQDHTAFNNHDPDYQHIDVKKDQIARAHGESIVGLSFSSCGRHLITVGNDKRVRIWKSDSGHLYANNITCNRYNSLPYQIKVLPIGGDNDDILALPNAHGDIALWPLQSHDTKAIHSLDGHLHPVNGIAYRPHTNQIITGGSDGMIIFWDTPPAPIDIINHKDTNAIDDDNHDTWSDDDIDDNVPIEIDSNGNNGGNKRKKKKRRFIPAIIKRLLEEVRAMDNDTLQNTNNTILTTTTTATTGSTTTNSSITNNNIIINNPSGGFMTGELEIQSKLQEDKTEEDKRNKNKSTSVRQMMSALARKSSKRRR